MTDQVKPMDREAWEKLVDAHARAVIEYNSPSGKFRFGDLQGSRTALIENHLALQTQLTEAKAEVERLRGCHVHRLYFDIDPHNFSTRPCSTCEAISAVTKTDFGCKALRVEKARQPK